MKLITTPTSSTGANLVWGLTISEGDLDLFNTASGVDCRR